MRSIQIGAFMLNYQFDPSCHASPAWDYIQSWVWIDDPGPGIYDRFGVKIRIWFTGKVEVIG